LLSRIFIVMDKVKCKYIFWFYNDLFLPKIINENVKSHCHPNFTQIKMVDTWNGRPLSCLLIHCSNKGVRCQLRGMSRILIIFRRNKSLQNLNILYIYIFTSSIIRNFLFNYFPNQWSNCSLQTQSDFRGQNNRQNQML